MKVIVTEATPTYPNGILDQLTLASKQPYSGFALPQLGQGGSRTHG